MKLIETGIVSGRFQPLHNGHLDYLLAAKKRCKFLVIGITCPDQGLAGDNAPDANRVVPSSNPLNYYERLIMVRDSLLGAGVKREDFEIVPFPMSYSRALLYNAPAKATYYVTVFDDWGVHKLSKIRKMGFTVRMERLPGNRKITATKIREAILIGSGGWKKLVPASVARQIGTAAFRRRLAALRAAEKNRPA